ncbi:hypothetical protein GH733_004044 [Mirounga leonina]|nr:hypothetical protein GH733_004044 [Mirounga leonina]
MPCWKDIYRPHSAHLQKTVSIMIIPEAKPFLHPSIGPYLSLLSKPQQQNFGKKSSPFFYCWDYKSRGKGGQEQRKLTMDTITGKMQALFLLLAILFPPEAGAVLSLKASKPLFRGSLFERKLSVALSPSHAPTPKWPFWKWSLTRGMLPAVRKITVTLGAHDIKQEESTWQKLEVSEQIIHPNYNSFTKLNDIMLPKGQSPCSPGLPLFHLGECAGLQAGEERE